MNQVDGVSDMVSLLCGFVWGKAQKGDNAAAWPPGVLSRRKLLPSTHTDTKHFNFSLYAIGALPATVSVLEPRGSESAAVLSLLWKVPLKRKLLRIP